MNPKKQPDSNSDLKACVCRSTSQMNNGSNVGCGAGECRCKLAPLQTGASTSNSVDHHVQQSDVQPSPSRLVPSSSGSRSDCCPWLRRLFRNNNNRHQSIPTPAAYQAPEIIRLLMVGKGDVGKSTIIKQLQHLCTCNPSKYVMYDQTWSARIQTFTLAQRTAEKQQILRNILHCIGTLLNKVEDFDLSFDTDENRSIAERVRKQIGDVDAILRSLGVELTVSMADDIAALWRDNGVQKAWDRRREYPISDYATEYFLAPDKLKQIVTPEYIPTADDIIRARNPTRGIQDYNFEIEGTKFSFRDMGGQPIEMARFPYVVGDWLNECGESSRKYILFVASLADYNQRLPNRPPKDTQLLESIRLMQILMNIEPLRNTGFILFLNKRDILEEKLRTFNDFADHFSDNNPRQNSQQPSNRARRRLPKKLRPQEAEHIIGGSFHLAAQETLRRDRPLYMHFTCATDMAQMDGIIGAVRVDILFRYMQTGIPFP